jgi:hypothetical protein
MRCSALISAALLLSACGNQQPWRAPAEDGGTGMARAAGETPPVRPEPIAPAAPREEGSAPLSPSNPLGLPPAKINLDTGKRVFTFTQELMAAARPGTTLVLSAATVAGIEGDDLIIEGHGGPSYKVHPGYVIPVPDVPKLRIGDAVLTERGGLMKHAVVLRFVKDRIAVRFTDVERGAPEALLMGGNGAPTAAGPSKAARFVRQVEGLAPGNYAALHQGSEWLHVLLVSAAGEGEARRWLALGFGGAAQIAVEGDLRPIPVRYSPKLGSVVWAEWSGKMRRATVQGADEPALFTVKYERAGRPATLGWGLLMAPLQG